jgi:hypothetical protein
MSYIQQTYLSKVKEKPGMVTHTSNPSHLGVNSQGKGRGETLS